MVNITRKILAFWFDSLFQKKRTNWTVKYLENTKVETTLRIVSTTRN